MAAAAPKFNVGNNMSVNDTGCTPSSFVLVGIPGLEVYHIWFAAPLTVTYIIILLGNMFLLLVLKTVLSFHKPMYFFISQLAFCDLTLSSCVLPKFLSILWFNDGEIPFSSCLIQMFLSNCFLALESSILLTMAFDRFVAVCNPLRYYSILTNSLIAKIAATCLVRAVVVVTPLPLLNLRLKFCSRYVAHSSCENMAVARLSCSDITANIFYGVAITVSITGLDMVCIVLSYIQILRAILRLPLKEARSKAFGTCGSHICIISAFYLPLFCFVVLNRLNYRIAPYVHVIFGNLCMLFSPLVNPFIYGLTLKEVQVGGHQLFRKLKVRIHF